MMNVNAIFWIAAGRDRLENPRLSLGRKPLDVAQLSRFGGRFQFIDRRYAERLMQLLYLLSGQPTHV